MFPINPTLGAYDPILLDKFDPWMIAQQQQMSNRAVQRPLIQLLPKVCKAGEDAGTVTLEGADWLGLRKLQLDLAAKAALPILVAPAEGDQVAALAGSLIGETGMISCSFGTSVCANHIRHHPPPHASTILHPAIDPFSAADGKLVYMIWLRNGTTFLNTIVESYKSMLATIEDDNNNKVDSPNSAGTTSVFAQMMSLLVNSSEDDCGGLLAIPFMDDEPGLQIEQGGTAMIIGWNPQNVQRPGNVVKAALLSTMFNLRMGCEILKAKELEQHRGCHEQPQQQQQPLSADTVAASNDEHHDNNVPVKVTDELVLTGGLAKTPECGQILADVFNTPVRLWTQSSDEGSGWGAAILAKYRHLCATATAAAVPGESSAAKTEEPSSSMSSAVDWVTFLNTIAVQHEQQQQRFQPNPALVAVYDQMFRRYCRLISLNSQLKEAVTLP